MYQEHPRDIINLATGLNDQLDSGRESSCKYWMVTIEKLSTRESSREGKL